MFLTASMFRWISLDCCDVRWCYRYPIDQVREASALQSILWFNCSYGEEFLEINSEITYAIRNSFKFEFWINTPSKNLLSFTKLRANIELREEQRGATMVGIAVRG